MHGKISINPHESKDDIYVLNYTYILEDGLVMTLTKEQAASSLAYLSLETIEKHLQCEVFHNFCRVHRLAAPYPRCHN